MMPQAAETGLVGISLGWTGNLSAASGSRKRSGPCHHAGPRAVGADAPSGAGQAVTSVRIVKEETMQQQDQIAGLISSGSNENFHVPSS